MEKIGGNHWKFEMCEIKVIGGCWFTKINRNDKKHFDAANECLNLVIKDKGLDGFYGQVILEGKPWPTEEEVAAKIKHYEEHGLEE